MHVLNHNSVLIFKGFPQQQDGEEKTERSAQKESQGLERGAELKMKTVDAQTQDLGRKGVGEYRFRRHTLRKANKVED